MNPSRCQVTGVNLAAGLPAMQCDRCGSCCGPVLCTEAECHAVDTYVTTHSITKTEYPVDSLTCPYFAPGVGCLVYPVRPFLCRLYGHTPKLLCAREHNTDVAADVEHRLTREYKREPLIFLVDIDLHEMPYLLAEGGLQ